MPALRQNTLQGRSGAGTVCPHGFVSCPAESFRTKKSPSFKGFPLRDEDIRSVPAVPLSLPEYSGHFVNRLCEKLLRVSELPPL